MSLLPFLVLTIGGAVIAVLARGSLRVSATVSWAALVAAVVAALAIRPGDVLAIGGSGIATTEYLRLFLALGTLTGLLLALIGLATGTHRDAPAVTLAVLGAAGLGLALPDPRLAVLALAAGGAAAVIVTIAPVGARAGSTVGIRALRATVLASTMAIAATAWIGRDLSELAAQPTVFGLAYLAVALAVAVRFGAIPFHAWAARVADAVPETTLPLVTAIGPAAFAIVALAWADTSIAPLLVDLDAVRAVVLAIAIASIVLAAVAAWIQDDIEHVVGYAVIGDAGVVMLAIAALDPEAWAPARTWILALVVTRSAFAAWAAATRASFHTGRLPELHGWALRSPILGLALATIVLASIGLPGLAAFEARATLVELALEGPVAALVLLATLSPLVFYGRLAVIGVARPEGRPADRPESTSRRPRVEPFDVTDVRGWIARTWAGNRVVAATAGTLMLAILAVAVSAGGFGAPEAAAGLPPALDGAVESFEPEPEPEPEPELPFESFDPEPEPESEP